jgi:hypothetical protein
VTLLVGAQPGCQASGEVLGWCVEAEVWCLRCSAVYTLSNAISAVQCHLAMGGPWPIVPIGMWKQMGHHAAQHHLFVVTRLGICIKVRCCISRKLCCVTHCSTSKTRTAAVRDTTACSTSKTRTVPWTGQSLCDTASVLLGASLAAARSCCCQLAVFVLSIDNACCMQI